jgi:cyclopropane fatty-acyl-phospholipid synthase-like methyltransferase
VRIAIVGAGVSGLVAAHLLHREHEIVVYDERFRRLWELYLSYCEGGFRERRIQDVQLLLAKPRFR